MYRKRLKGKKQIQHFGMARSKNGILEWPDSNCIQMIWQDQKTAVPIQKALKYY